MGYADSSFASMAMTLSGITARPGQKLSCSSSPGAEKLAIANGTKRHQWRWYGCHTRGAGPGTTAIRQV